MNLQSFKSAALTDSKLVYYCNDHKMLNPKVLKHILSIIFFPVGQL